MTLPGRIETLPRGRKARDLDDRERIILLPLPSLLKRAVAAGFLAIGVVLLLQPLFVGLLVGVILIVGGLTFFPALALGPIVEHLAMQAGQLF